VRALQANARPRSTDAATSIEAMTPVLADALAREAAMPGADTSIAAGDQYSRLGVLDAAMEHYSRAVKIDPTRSDAYDRMARIWRDWGFPNLALGDAYRAAFYAPRSAVVQNTLGTILQALGQTSAARDAYRRALTFDSQAAYAWNNLCSAYLAEARPHEALSSCQRAVELSPALRTAQANLAAALRSDPGTGSH
jgi:tetratricopeptide (TPR) repeat protein